MTKQQPLPWWVPGDWNAFFGLGLNSLLNILVLSGLLLGVVRMPPDLVFGQIVPAVGVMVFLSNIYYAWMGRRLARKTGRRDVTAMPAGPSVPHMFIVVFVIMLPVRIATDDPVLAWQAGLAWVFIEGLVNLSGVFIGPLVLRLSPRAALLGTLAGVSIAYISMAPAMQIFLTPTVGLVSLTIVLAGWLAGVRFPFNIPAGLVALGVGTAIGWATGLMSAEALRESVSQAGFALPTLAVDKIFGGFSQLAPLLVTAIPFGIYDFIEGIDNVESAKAAGDEYNVREVLLVDGISGLIGTALGSPFANAVYIGHPGWKRAGGRIGYSVAAGALVLVATCFSLVPLLLDLIPLVAILPILLYIGALIGAQAFQETPRAHAPAIVIALVPNFAGWALTLVDGTLNAAGTTAEEVGSQQLVESGVFYDGLRILGGGAILTGLVLGSIVVFMIDRKPVWAAGYAAAGAGLSYFGVIHSPELGVGAAPVLALSYLLMASLMFLFKYLPHSEEADSDPGAAI